MSIVSVYCKSLLRLLIVLIFQKSKMLKKQWFYYVFVQNCSKTIGFIRFSLQIVQKQVVLLCFRSKLFKNHWFYCVFVQKCWKSIGFIVFSLKNPSKMSVLSVLDSKTVIKRVKNNVFCSTSYIFSENPCAKMQKKTKTKWF